MHVHKLLNKIPCTVETPEIVVKIYVFLNYTCSQNIPSADSITSKLLIINESWH